MKAKMRTRTKTVVLGGKRVKVETPVGRKEFKDLKPIFEKIVKKHEASS